MFTNAEMVSLVTMAEWSTGVTWTVHMTVSSNCSNALNFGFAGGGGQMMFTVPANADGDVINVVDVLDGPTSEVYLRARSECLDACSSVVLDY